VSTFTHLERSKFLHGSRDGLEIMHQWAFSEVFLDSFIAVPKDSNPTVVTNAFYTDRTKHNTSTHAENAPGSTEMKPYELSSALSKMWEILYSKCCEAMTGLM
jgi:hypothetical protein